MLSGVAGGGDRLALYTAVDSERPNLGSCFHRVVLNGSPRYGEYLPGPQGMFQSANGAPKTEWAWMDVGLLAELHYSIRPVSGLLR